MRCLIIVSVFRPSPTLFLSTDRSVFSAVRWDPHMEDDVFMCQSAHLYASYYLLQITVHRPFIPSPRKASGVSFPSLAICTNAARSCVHVLDVQAKRSGGTSYLNQVYGHIFSFFEVHSPRTLLDGLAGLWHRTVTEYMGRKALWKRSRSGEGDG